MFNEHSVHDFGGLKGKIVEIEKAGFICSEYETRIFINLFFDNIGNSFFGPLKPFN